MSEVTELINCENADLSTESILKQLVRVDGDGNLYLNLEVHTESVTDYATCANQEVTPENLLKMIVSDTPALKVVLP